MRRRGRSVEYGVRQLTPGHSTPGNSTAYPEERPLATSEVPDEWRRYAREPWRIIYPDLEWKPPEVE